MELKVPWNPSQGACRGEDLHESCAWIFLIQYRKERRTIFSKMKYTFQPMDISHSCYRYKRSNFHRMIENPWRVLAREQADVGISNWSFTSSYFFSVLFPVLSLTLKKTRILIHFQLRSHDFPLPVVLMRLCYLQYLPNYVLADISGGKSQEVFCELLLMPNVPFFTITGIVLIWEKCLLKGIVSPLQKLRTQ